jgi:hypothetical protein
MTGEKYDLKDSKGPLTLLRRELIWSTFSFLSIRHVITVPLLQVSN